MYNFREGQVKETLENFGNCIAASIPITLATCIETGEIKRGDYCLLSGTAAGFAIGSVLIRF
jgi:3-oxoacyl-[acyl-carrier-protein] synthase-3